MGVEEKTVSFAARARGVLDGFRTSERSEPIKSPNEAGPQTLNPKP